MKGKIFTLTAFLLVFATLVVSYVHASAFDVSIDRVKVNSAVVIPYKQNFIKDNSTFEVSVEFTALVDLKGIHVEAILKDLKTGNVVADASPNFDLQTNVSSSRLLSLALLNGMNTSSSFELTVRILDKQGNIVEKTYGIELPPKPNQVQQIQSSASSIFDVSIDRVRLNGASLAESSKNLIADSDIFLAVVDFTTLGTLEKAHVEATLRGRQSGGVISNSTATFDLNRNQSSTAALTLVLIDRLKRETDFDLTIKIVDAKDNSETKTYGIKTRESSSARAFDVSIDRVMLNNKTVAPSRTNFIDKNSDFDILVDFTALEDMKDAHAEAVLRDLKSGTVVADASPNFDLGADLSSSKLLRLQLLDGLRQSSSFELTVRLVDAEGKSVQQLYGIQTRASSAGGGGIGGSGLDISIDGVEAESKTIAENENNLVPLKNGQKKLGVTVRLTSLENIKDTHIDVILTFENGDSVADGTTVFDLSKGQHISKKLELPLSGKFGQSKLLLKLMIADADGNSKEASYSLKVTNTNLPFVDSSISLTPDNNAQAGRSIVATISLRNLGVFPLESVNAKVSIPELGISSSKTIPIKTGRLSETREDVLLNIPQSAESGEYTVRLEVTPKFGDSVDVKEVPISIIGKSEQPNRDAISKSMITVPIAIQDIDNDGSEVIYPIKLKNDGTISTTYTLLLDGMEWADLRLSDSNVFVLNPKESKTINIYASTKSDKEGEQTFVAAIKSGDNVLSQVQLKGNVIAVEKKSSYGGLGSLGIIIAGLVILLVAIGFFVIKKLPGSSGSAGNSGAGQIIEYIPGEAGAEPYYSTQGDGVSIGKDISAQIPNADKGEAYY